MAEEEGTGASRVLRRPIGSDGASGETRPRRTPAEEAAAATSADPATSRPAGRGKEPEERERGGK